MSATPATIFSTEMGLITANAGGQVNTLLASYLNGAKDRNIIANIPLVNTITSGTVIGVARIPLPFVLTGITLLTDTSLGSTTIALGNAGNGNTAKYSVAATLTSINTPTFPGLAASMGVPITSGFDCVSGLATGYTVGGNGGALYEDIILTTGAATAPASGNLRIIFNFAID